MATTDELIEAAHKKHPRIPTSLLRKTIPGAVDLLYAVRDAGGSMHDAAGAVAIAAMVDTLDNENVRAHFEQSQINEDVRRLNQSGICPLCGAEDQPDRRHK